MCTLYTFGTLFWYFETNATTTITIKSNNNSNSYGYSKWQTVEYTGNQERKTENIFWPSFHFGW